MEVITDADSQRLLEKATEARQSVIGELAGHDGSASDRESFAGDLFRRYSCELLQDLLRVSSPGDNADGASWVRSRHDEQLLELGRQLRDAFPEGEERHAVAQIIQRELLEAERRLKSALKAVLPPRPSHPQ